LPLRLQVGLVGMHIAHHTERHTDWIWSSFEQVDDVVKNYGQTQGNEGPAGGGGPFIL
jgi:hypothetical protein